MLSLRARLRGKRHKGGQVRLSPEPTQTTTTSGLDEDDSESATAPLVRKLASVTEGKVVEDFGSEQLHFIVDYIGSAHISEAQSVPLLLETLKRIKKQQFETIRVDFTILDGVLKVSNVESNALLLTAPLYAVSLCAKEQLRGYEHTFGLNITRKKIHMCHAFQAGSKLEAASIVRSVALAFKVIGKMIRDKQDRERRQRRTQSTSSSDRPRTNSEASSSTVEESFKRHHHIHWKQSLESGNDHKSPLAKRKPFGKSSTSPSILRQSSGGLYSSGRHVEFSSALSPVPSDSSNSDSETGKKEKVENVSSVSVKVKVAVDIHQSSVEKQVRAVNTKCRKPVLAETGLQQDQDESEMHASGKGCGRTGTQRSVEVLDMDKLKTQLMQDVLADRRTNPSEKPGNSQLPKETKPEFSSREKSTQQSVSPRVRKISRTESINAHKKLVENRARKDSRSFVPLRKDSRVRMELKLPPPDEIPDSILTTRTPLVDSETLEEEEDVGPIIEAVQKGDMIAVEKKLDEGVSINARDSSRRSLLYHAVMYGQTEVAQLLIKRGADVNWEGPEDKSPLHVAAAAGNRAATQLLLENGANVRAKDSAFSTPLHMSAGHLSNLEVSYLLMEHGARIFENNLQGLRPLDFEPQLREMQRLLVQSACEAFVAADLSKSRSISGTSSTNHWAIPNSIRFKSSIQSPRLERMALLQSGSFRRYRSSSFCSIPDLTVRGDNSPSSVRRGIKRSESMHISGDYSPRLGHSRRKGIRRSQSFQKDLKILKDEQRFVTGSGDLSPKVQLEQKKLGEEVNDSPKVRTEKTAHCRNEDFDSSVAKEGMVSQEEMKSCEASVSKGYDAIKGGTVSQEQHFEAGVGEIDDDDDDDDMDTAGEMSSLLPVELKQTCKVLKVKEREKEREKENHEEKGKGRKGKKGESSTEKGTFEEKESLTERTSKLISIASSDELVPLSASVLDFDESSRIEEGRKREESRIISPFAAHRRSISDLTDYNLRPNSDLIRLGDSPLLASEDPDTATTQQSASDAVVVPEHTSSINEDAHSAGVHLDKPSCPPNTRQYSFDSDQSTTASVPRSVSECEASSFTSTGSHIIRDEEPVIDALVSIVLLSGNPECHSHLLAYLCLPKASGQLCLLAHLPVMSVSVASHVAVLIGNLFNLEGTESRKRSVEAGLIKTVLKLVDCPEPIQSTCLSILQNILDFDNDREYSTALDNIPLEPLLNILQVSDTDSGAFDLRPGGASPPNTVHTSSDRGRVRNNSMCSRGSSFDERHREMSPVSFGRVSARRNSFGASEMRGDLTRQQCSVGSSTTKRNSMCSMGSFGDKDHLLSSMLGHSFGHPHPAGATLPFDHDIHHNKALPRLVATKMLAATSMHHKMQLELGKLRPLSLLVETLSDSNPEIVTYTAATLANIAMNISNHVQIQHSGAADGLKQLLSHSDTRICYHAARGLVYLGHLDVEGVYLFDRCPGDDRLDVLFADTTGEEHLYVRGASIEKIVEIITKDPSLLWGGINLPIPSMRGKTTTGSKKTNSPGGRSLATEEQIMVFLLTTYKSFVHPVILMRLLLHRFHDPWFDKYFDGDPSTGQMAKFGPLPTVHIRLMRLWEAWLEKYPQDFIENALIASELGDLILPMRKAGGPYLPCADDLEYLLHSLVEYNSMKKSTDLTQEDHCHHSILYEQCQKAVVSGSLPCTLEDAAYLSALQLYIEDLCPTPGLTAKQKFFPGSNKDKLSVSRIKQSLNPSFYRVKNMSKRIKYQQELFVSANLSERNAKHNYIDCCQNMPGYGCKCFRLKECLATVSKKGEVVRRLLGVNPKRIVLLDEKMKSLVGSWHFKDLKRWSTVDGDTRLRLEFSNLVFQFQLEDKGMYKEISDTFLSCTQTNWQNLDLDFSPWGKYAEETQLWGAVAMASIAPPTSAKKSEPESCSPRGRACSSAASSLTEKQGRARRHVSMSGKLSSSAPHNPGLLAAAGSLPLPVNTPGMVPNATLVGTQTSSVGPTSVVSTSSAGCSTDELLMRSLQSSTGTPLLSWEGTSFLQRRPSLHRKCSRESSISTDEPMSPTDALTFEPSNYGRNASRRRYVSTDSNASSLAGDSPGSSNPVTPSSSRRSTITGYVLPSQGVQNLDGSFATSPRGQMLICHCPPDAELPSFDRRNFSAFNLLQYPKELARQITLIDHENFCAVTAADIQKKIAQGTGKKKSNDEPRLLVERLADRFNQLSMWVVSSILEDGDVEHRAMMNVGFIETAKQCLELRNYNAVMAIIAALGSAPIRRLAQTRELVAANFMDQFSKIEMLMETKNNYKRYREILRSSPTPAVPYFGIYMKDLTFITEGNPDFLKGGLINLTKRRQVFVVIDEVRRFQKKSYNFQEVPEVREYLLSQEIRTEAELHKISRLLEPGPARRHSESAPPRPVLRQFRSSSVGRRCATLTKSSSTLASGTDSVC